MEDPNWERDAIVKLASAGLQEQRRARKWGIFFKFLGFAYFGILLFSLLGGVNKTGMSNISERHTALVDLSGVIAEGEEAGADNVVAGLRDAFENKNSAAVILRVNSPGGSPVQSAYINSEIVRLRELHPDKPIYAVIADICASGGIYVAAAADQIYANESSIVGSIGVITGGFGFVDAIDKLGVERRVMTAGEHKALLDPFSPVDEYEQQHIQTMLDELHQTFIDTVKQGRGDRLKDNPDLFSGLFWSGSKALELGLIDGIGSAGYVAREIVGEETIVSYTKKQDFLQRFADRIGSAIMSQLRIWMSTPNLQ